MDEPRPRDANEAEQKEREPRQRIAAPRKNPDVSPRIEIMLNRQQKDVLVSAAIPKLGAICVLLPAHAAQQCPIAGTKRDEIAAAAMIRSEDQFSRYQLRESALDVDRAEPRAIPADRDHFVIAELRDSFDRVFKAGREIPARLPVNVWRSSA
jgi:hypothetical protein